MTLCFLPVTGCVEGAVSEILLTRTEGGDMATLAIDFQDGFVDDTIVIHLNGKERFRKEHVSTKLLLGLAVSFRDEVEVGPVSIQINIETKNITQTIDLEVSGDTYLGVSNVNGMIEYIVLDEPFGYA